MAATSSGRRFLARFERQAATPRTARRLTELMCAIDVTALLPSVAVPTLVIHRVDDAAYGVARPRPGGLHPGRPAGRAARPRPLPVQRGHRPAAGRGRGLRRRPAVGAPVAGPVPGHRGVRRHRRLDRRRVPDMGDAAFRRLLDGFAAEGRRCVEAQRGEVVRPAGDGLVATFDGPGRACGPPVTCAGPWPRSAPSSSRGPHRRDRAPGERRGGDRRRHRQPAGRLRPSPGPWVSCTVTDLVAGCGLAFEDRGERELPGVPGTWAAFEAAC